MDYLEIRNVSKKFESKSVLKKVNLVIEKLSFVTLVGQSGCGKSTLLRIMAGLENVDNGQILINGKDITNLPPQQREIGMVFQNYALFPHLNVFNNVAYGLKQRKLNKTVIEVEVNKALEKVNLLDKVKYNVCALSGGEQQRVALARAIVTHPKILLLDEPLSSLDNSLRIRARNELKRLQNEIGITTVYVTHDQSEALALSDKIAILNQGEIQQFGSPMEIYNRPVNDFSAGLIGYNLFTNKQFSQLFGYKVDGTTLAILPEHVQIHKANASTNVYIKDILFTGALTEYILSSESNLFKSVSFTSLSSLFQRGEHVSLSVTKENVKLIDCI